MSNGHHEQAHGREPDFRLLFESLPWPCMVLAADPPRFTIVAASDSYKKATQKRREEMIGRPVFEVFPDNPDHPSGAEANSRASFQRVIDRRAPDQQALQQHDISRLPEDGGGFVTRFWQPLNAPVLDEEGRVRYIIHRVEDVTELVLAQHRAAQKGSGALDSGEVPVEDRVETRLIRREADLARERENSFEEARQMFAEAERLSQTGAWKWDLVADVWTFSDGWLAVHGCRERTLAPEQLLQIAHPEDRPTITHAFQQLRLGLATYDLEHRIVRQDDGRVRIVRAEGQYVKDGHGRVLRAYGFVQDVTEQRQAENALRLSEQKFARAFAANPAAIALTSLDDGLFVDVNETWCQWLGYRAEEVIGQSALSFDIWPGPADRLRFVEELRRTGSIRNWEQEFRRKSGERFVAIFSADVVRVEGQTLVLSALIDITKRRRAEEKQREAAEALKRTVEELARSNRDLEQFAYVASHDLQEPLRMVTGFVDLLRMEFQDRLDERGLRYIQFALEGATRMRDLVNDLLAYSRINRAELKPGPVDVTTCLETALHHLQAAIEESQASVEHDSLPVVRADCGQLTQLFQNLIANAIKFHKPGERPLVRISACREDGQWVFSVRDNGIGIPPAYHERVFTIFQRLHSRQEYAGTGIGLAVCQRIAERHGGRIWIESQDGVGTDFRFTLGLSES